MRVTLAVASLVAASFAAAPAFAQAKADAAKPKGASFRSEDPESKPGPYLEAIGKGEAAFSARDWPGAIKAFQDAVKVDPNKIMGHYRLGEAQLASGKPDEAKATWQAAQSKKGTDEQKAKVLFVLADLEERAKNWQAAKDAWGVYAKFLQDKAGAKGYPATSVERVRQADRRMKDEKDYGVVKQRIIAREAEKTKEAEENAKKDKLNK